MRHQPTNEQQKALAVAKNQLVLQYPFYSVVAMSVPLEFDPNLPTGATNGSWIRFNPEWFMELSRGERVGVLCHEAEHIVRLHMWRMGNRKAMVKTESGPMPLWNIATDAIINHSILSQGLALPQPRVELDWAAGKSEEEVYAKLLQEASESDEVYTGGEGQGGEGQGGEGQGGDGPPAKGLTPDDVVPGEQSGESESRAKEIAKSAVTMAKATGNVPAGMEALIDGITEPAVDWREHMAAWMAELAQLDNTWARPNRTWLTRGVRLPGTQSEDALGELGVVLDQSGSMSTEEVRQSFSELCGMVATTNPRRVVVVYLDADVAHVDVFDNPSEAEIKDTASRRACGGTDMTVGLDYLEREYPDVAGVVVLTDGYTPFGQPRGYPVLWAVTSPDVQAAWGTTVYVDVTD